MLFYRDIYLKHGYLAAQWLMWGSPTCVLGSPFSGCPHPPSRFGPQAPDGDARCSSGLASLLRTVTQKAAVSEPEVFVATLLHQDGKF